MQCSYMVCLCVYVCEALISIVLFIGFENVKHRWASDALCFKTYVQHYGSFSAQSMLGLADAGAGSHGDSFV